MQALSRGKTRGKSARFRVRGCCTLYLVDYRPAFASSLLLYRRCYQWTLRSTFPERRASPVYHVPQVYHAWVRLRLSAGGLARLRQENWEPLNRPRTFLVKPVSIVGSDR